MNNEIIKLAKAYSKHGNLWNPNDENYSNRQVRHRSISKIADEMGPYWDVPKVTKKLHILRTQFNAEFRRESRSMLNDPDDAQYTSKWKYYSYLSFLKPGNSHIIIPNDDNSLELNNNLSVYHENSNSNCSTSISSSSSIQSEQSTNNNIPVSTTKRKINKKRKHDSIEDNDDSNEKLLVLKEVSKVLCDSLDNNNKKQSNESKDPLLIWCEGLASSLKLLDTFNLERTKLEIRQVIFKNIENQMCHQNQNVRNGDYKNIFEINIEES